MRWAGIVASLLLLCSALGSAALAGFAIFQVSSPQPATSAVTCNLVTGVVTGGGTGPCTSGATCNGTADDSMAFAEFNKWALAWQATPHVGQIRLDINSGKTCEILDGDVVVPPGFAAKWFSTGIKSLLVVGYGATLGNGDGSGTAGFFLGNRASIQSGSGFFGSSNIWTARLDTVSAGSTTLTVTVADAAQASIFTASTWALITGFSIQVDSTPPSAAYLEYVYITNVSGRTITIQSPLTNTYLSTWPLYDAGSPGGRADLGGPATLYLLDPNWDGVWEYRGLTINFQARPTNTLGRSVTLRDVTWVGDDRCTNPTQSIIWATINSDFSICSIEADKLVDQFYFTNSTINGMKFLSSSINLFQSSGGSVIQSLQGTPKKAVLTDTTVAVSFRPGALANGRSDEVICTRCNLPAGVGYQGVVENQQNAGIPTTYTISGGTITVPNSAWVGIEDPPTRWAVPGTNLFWTGLYDFEGPAFQVVGVTQSGTNTIITTTLPGSMNTWPTVPLGSGVLGIRVHPAPKFTCTGCYGSDAAIALNSATPAAPLGSYDTRHITSWAWTSGFHFANVLVWGTMTSVTFAIATPYNGSVNPFQFYCSSATYQTSSPSTTATFYSPQVDMRTGPRTVTITPSGVTGNVGGDSGLTLPWADTWDLGGCEISVQQSIAAALGSPVPDITFTIQTDQGVVNP